MCAGTRFSCFKNLPLKALRHYSGAPLQSHTLLGACYKRCTAFSTLPTDSCSARAARGSCLAVVASRSAAGSSSCLSFTLTALRFSTVRP